MPTECSRDLFGYEVVEGRQVVAAFDGGEVTSDAGALLLGAIDRAIGLVRRLLRRRPDPSAGSQGRRWWSPRSADQVDLDLDATDDPVHGPQEGRFFHGYYDGYCYLPLYVFCGRHLLAAKLRRSNIDASAGAVAEVERIVTQIRACWPRVRIILRADSGFAGKN